MAFAWHETNFFHTAAMRLRQLATTQAVHFYAFPETDLSIRDTCKLNDIAKVTSSHVIFWLLEQTCLEHEQVLGLYIAQGTDFCNLTASRWDNPAYLTDAKERAAYIQALQHPEEQTLEEMYGHRSGQTDPFYPTKKRFPQLEVFKESIIATMDMEKKSASSIVHTALEEVEQEREVEFQVEEVREVQRPVRHRAHKYSRLNSNIHMFAISGELAGGEGYESFSAALAKTSVGRKFGIVEIETNLFVSTQFMKTIVTNDDRPNDSFMISFAFTHHSNLD